MSEFTVSTVPRNSENESVLREACKLALKEGRRFEVREYYSANWWTEFKIWNMPTLPAQFRKSPSIGYTGCVICGEFTDHGGLQCPKMRATSLDVKA